MTADVLALARDVDRLFRARQDGRARPMGERSDRDWWIPDPSESAAASIDRKMRGFANPTGSYYDQPPTYMRTRAHVAVLALTETAAFALRLVEMDAQRLRVEESYRRKVAEIIENPKLRTDTQIGRAAFFYGVSYVYLTASVTHACARRPFGLPALEPQRQADVERTAAYLVDLQERLRIWREGEEVRQANADREDEERRHREDMERTEALVEIDGDVLAAIA